MAGGRTREGTRAPKPLGERLPVLARTGIAAWCLAVAPPQGPAAGQIVPGQATRLVLTDARWVDVEEGRVIAGRALIIDGGRIEWIGSADDLGAADAAMAIDLDGRFVSPGLVDLHVHTDAAAEPLFLANGVTAVRVMMGTPEALAWRARTEEADGAALRVYVAGPLLAGTPVPWAHEIVEAPEAARASVARHADAGYDYIKVYDGLSAEVYRAIVEEAAGVSRSSDTCPYR